jgi:hypothetical protein
MGSLMSEADASVIRLVVEFMAMRMGLLPLPNRLDVFANALDPMLISAGIIKLIKRFDENIKYLPLSFLEGQFTNDVCRT